MSFTPIYVLASCLISSLIIILKCGYTLSSSKAGIAIAFNSPVSVSFARGVDCSCRAIFLLCSWLSSLLSCVRFLDDVGVLLLGGLVSAVPPVGADTPLGFFVLSFLYLLAMASSFSSKTMRPFSVGFVVRFVLLSMCFVVYKSACEFVQGFIFFNVVWRLFQTSI